MSAEFLGALAFVLVGLAVLGVFVGAVYVMGKRAIREAEVHGSPAERVRAARADRPAVSESPDAEIPGGSDPEEGHTGA